MLTVEEIQDFQKKLSEQISWVDLQYKKLGDHHKIETVIDLAVHWERLLGCRDQLDRLLEQFPIDETLGRGNPPKIAIVHSTSLKPSQHFVFISHGKPTTTVCIVNKVEEKLSFHTRHGELHFVNSWVTHQNVGKILS